MKNYIKPMVLSNEELAEGVFAGSGVDCYTFSAYIVQKPETGRETYTVQMNGGHNAADGHHCGERTVVIAFNKPVTYVSSNASATSGSGTSTLTLTFTDGVNGSYHNNAHDNIGLGQLVIEAEAGLAIADCYCTYCNRSCDQPGH